MSVVPLQDVQLPETDYFVLGNPEDEGE